MIWNSRLKIFIAVLSVFFCSSLFCSSAFAYDYSYSFERDLNTSQIYSVNGDYFTLSKNGDGSVFRENMDWYGDSPLRFDQTSHIHLSINGSLPAYSLIKVDIFFGQVKSGDYTYSPFCPSSRDGSYTVVDCSYGEYGMVSAIIYVDDEVSSMDLYNNTFYSVSGARYTVRVSSVSGVKLATPLSSSDLTVLQNSLNNNIDEFAQAVDNDFTTIINLLRDTSVQESIAANTERTADLIQSQNDQQQEQYESEKEEEAEREQSSSDDVDSLTSSFSFQITDPLSYIFDSFTSNNACVSIPTIAGMLNSSETTYCPWFPSSVRNVLTPVFSITVTVLCYGFLVSWLRKGDN